jgi:4-amino-4-deoxy-L-arabinose transferase-like glycosyltransferase
MASVSYSRVGSRKAAGFVLIAGIVLFLPGLGSLPPIDRDESRFAEASRYMLESGEWIIPRVEGQPRLNKPPLIYWLQAASVWICQPEWSPEHGGIWAYRLPSALAACGVILLTCRLGTSMFTPSVGVWAALLLGSSMVLMVDGRQARADEVLLLSVMLSQFALWRIWDQAQQKQAVRWWLPVLLWSALGAGILTKGPVAPAITGLTIASLCVGTHEFRWLKSLRIGSGLGLVAMIVSPWVWMAANEVGWARLGDQWYREVFVRASTAQEGHGGWPGSFLLLLPVLFWPGSLTLIPLIRHAWRRGMPGRNRLPRRAELFCLAWFVPGLLIFELAGTKLPHYILPVFPPLALLAARSLFAVRQGWSWVTATYVGRFSLWGWLALTQAVGVGPLIALAWFGQLDMRREVVVPLVGVILVGADPGRGHHLRSGPASMAAGAGFGDCLGGLDALRFVCDCAAESGAIVVEFTDFSRDSSRRSRGSAAPGISRLFRG